MKLKLWLRRWSVSAPQMTIKSHLSWPFRAIFLAVVIGIGGAIAMWAYDLGRNFTGFNPAATRAQLTALTEQVNKLTAERDRFATTVNLSDSQINMERAAQKQIALQIKALETENAKLKEDLVFFESLLPVEHSGHGIDILRLTVDLAGSGQLRYRMLIMQGSKSPDFVGNLQLAVTVMQGGKNVIILYPDANVTDKNQFSLAFKHYQRMDGVVTLPEGAVIKTVQARVLEKGQVRVQQSANL